MLTILFLLSQSILTTIDPCCSQHGDICGDKCCDGTSFPKHCGTLQIISLPPVSSPNSTPPIEKKSLDGQGKNPRISINPNKQNKETSASKKWLYRWEDPNTGALFLSSTSPPWYRNSQYPPDYPRVLVYDEYHRLVDDTKLQPIKTEAETEAKNKVETPPP